MKKITLMVVAITISTLIFAQHQQQAQMLPKDSQISNTQKSEWVGNTALTGYSQAEAGYDYAIRFTAGTLSEGDEITKVQFYSDVQNLLGLDLNGGSYQIVIYEGGTFNEANGYDAITACGSSVYTQDYTATTSGPQEVELTTPYTIGTGEFWISIHCNELSIIGLGDEDETSLNGYLSSMDYSGTDYWVNNSFCANPPTCDESVVYPFTLSVYVDDGGAYIENSDLSAFYIDNETDQNIITELALGATDDLDLLPVIYNVGPDNADQIIGIEFTVDGTSQGSVDFDPATETVDGFIGVPGGVIYPVSLMTAEEMNTEGLTTFDVCIILTYAGVDNNTANNESCITIIRSTDITLGSVSSISVYPNPANNVINIANAENETIVIVNMIGEVVTTIENASANQSIDASSFAEGTYFVKINSEVFKVNVVK